jgi:hypothetical protein
MATVLARGRDRPGLAWVRELYRGRGLAAAQPPAATDLASAA